MLDYSPPGLRPSYWASVSGGKDSLYMLKLILSEPAKYPLDGVVHFELDIDFPFIKDVIDYMESECKKHNIRFVRIRPTKSWEDWYYTVNSKTGNIYGFPTRKCRWCNSKYKLNAKRQLDDFLQGVGFFPVYYIGYCADEFKRFNKRVNCNEVYPLADNNINEVFILEWAKNVPIFNDYYKYNRRCGCMYCPMMSRIGFAYLYRYYPEHYNKVLAYMRETEQLRESELGKPFSCIDSNAKYNADYLDSIIKNKWIYRLGG